MAGFVIAGLLAAAMSTLALGLMLSLCRGVAKADRRMRESKWELVEGKDLRGNTLGIGGIGSELAALGNALGMNVLVHTKRLSPERAKEHGVRFVELDELVPVRKCVSN